MSKTLLAMSAILFPVAASLCACTSDDGEETTCPAGTERCSCYRNGTCNDGLTCASNVCVSVGDGGASGATVAADGAQPEECDWSCNQIEFPTFSSCMCVRDLVPADGCGEFTDTSLPAAMCPGTWTRYAACCAISDDGSMPNDEVCECLYASDEDCESFLNETTTTPVSSCPPS